MAESIYIHRYELQSRAPLNKRSQRRGHSGALVRVGDGFGCIHPWPELGDLPLEEQLRRLAEGRTTPLLEQTLECCRIDGEFRARGENMFEGRRIPPSHYTLPQDWNEIPEGFNAVKMKCGRDREEVQKRIEEVMEACPAKLRLDYNGVFTHHLEFLKPSFMIVRCGERIDFVEDPTVLSPETEENWEFFRTIAPEVRFAQDQGNYLSGLPAVRVFKPAVQGMDWIKVAAFAEQDVVFTSYMDHPIGQLFAAWVAMSLREVFGQQVIDCGLVTHHLFDESDPFVAAMGPPEPILKPPPGTGLGFDDLLENLPWERLT